MVAFVIHGIKHYFATQVVLSLLSSTGSVRTCARLQDMLFFPLEWEEGVSLLSPGWPGTHYGIHQAVLELKEPLVSAPKCWS